MRSHEVIEAEMCCSSSPNGGRGSAVNLRSAVERVLRPLQAPALAVFCFFMVFLLSGGAWGEIKKEGGTIATLTHAMVDGDITTMPPSVIPAGV